MENIKKKKFKCDKLVNIDLRVRHQWRSGVTIPISSSLIFSLDLPTRPMKNCLGRLISLKQAFVTLHLA